MNKALLLFSLFSLLIVSCANQNGEVPENHLSEDDKLTIYNVDYFYQSDCRNTSLIVDDSGALFKELPNYGQYLSPTDALIKPINDYDVICRLTAINDTYYRSVPQKDGESIKLTKNTDYSISFYVREKIDHTDIAAWHYNVYYIKTDYLTVRSDSLIVIKNQNTHLYSVNYNNIDSGNINVTFLSKTYEFSFDYLDKVENGTYTLNARTHHNEFFKISPAKTKFKEGEMVEIVFGSYADISVTVMCNGFGLRLNEAVYNREDHLNYLKIPFPSFDMEISVALI